MMGNEIATAVQYGAAPIMMISDNSMYGTIAPACTRMCATLTPPVLRRHAPDQPGFRRLPRGCIVLAPRGITIRDDSENPRTASLPPLRSKDQTRRVFGIA